MEAISPSTSKQAATDKFNEPDVEDNLILNIKNEKAEIAQLDLKDHDLKGDIKQKSVEDSERIPKINFHCESCDMNEMVHYYGKEPAFVNGLIFIEETYVMRDPFQPPPMRWRSKPEYFIAIGSKCSICLCDVCKDVQCSIFYTKTFCLGCAAKTLKNFPVEIQSKVRKQLAMKK